MTGCLRVSSLRVYFYDRFFARFCLPLLIGQSLRSNLALLTPDWTVIIITSAQRGLAVHGIKGSRINRTTRG